VLQQLIPSKVVGVLGDLRCITDRVRVRLRVIAAMPEYISDDEVVEFSLSIVEASELPS
jgi:hypothetical protein